MSSPPSRLGQRIAQVIDELGRAGLPLALIGGLALAAHRVVRATTDVDLLVRAEDATAIDALLSKLGYRCIHRSADAANYLRDDERLDMLFAHREIARNLLASAAARHNIRLFDREPLLDELLAEI